MEERGKTTGIINRLPHFFDAANTESLFYQFVDIFAQILELAETDLLRVMRAHHVDTADDFGSKGFDADARVKGDLDKIFALYLEKLGGTSQLIQVNQELKETDIKNVSAFIKQLFSGNDSLSEYISQNLTDEKAKDIIKSYDVNNALFKVESFLKADALVIKLIVGKDAFTSHLQTKLSDETKQRLNAYDGSPNVAQELIVSLVQDFNRILADPQLFRKFQQLSVQIDLAKKLDDWLNNYSDEQLKKAVIINLAQILRRRLPLELQNPLYRPLKEQLTTKFWQRVLLELKQKLSDVSLCQQLLTVIEEVNNNYPATDSQVSEEFLKLLQQGLKALIELFVVKSIGELPTTNLSGHAQSLLTGVKTNDDLKLGNRLLLETVFPKIISSSNIPLETQVIKTLVDFLNQKILPLDEFYPDNQNYFDGLMLPLEAEKLIEKLAEKLTSEQLKRRNRLLLESAYPLYIDKSYDPYRERLKALIKVIRRGAATKEGIRDIVAANLGIFDDDPAAKNAKKQIKIEEYNPVVENTSYTWVYGDSNGNEDGLTEPPWSISNPNPIETIPSFIRVRVLELSSKGIKDRINFIFKPYLKNLKTNQVIEIINDTEGKIRLKLDDVLEFSGDGAIKVNGTVREGFKCKFVPLELGDSRWYFDAFTGEPGAIFDRGIFDVSRFDNKLDGYARLDAPSGYPGAIFDRGVFDISRFDNPYDSYAGIQEQQGKNIKVQVEWGIKKLTPGMFHVTVPWNIPGFTEKYAEGQDHPRSQISAIVDRVKAAGVRAVISYQYQFPPETHDIEDNLKLDGEIRYQEVQPQSDSNFAMDSENSLTEVQEMSDEIILSGVFDLTEFDSDNRFN
ncbi:MAG: hypothetical protein F6K39_10030 [Okeania sp. SIO3B3]|nr:hypothetical protein [Okeania sp. SIO3B3]